MRVSIFSGDICDATADAICTSTNPRLSLMMGTGAAVRERGGYEILRACEAIVAGGSLPAGSAHVTPAGKLPHKAIIHCVAGDASHRSSEQIVRLCTRSAVEAAAQRDLTSVALPVFGTGHARLKFDRAVTAMAEEIARGTKVDVVFVIIDEERVREAQSILERIFRSEIPVTWGETADIEGGSWLTDNDLW